MRIKIINFQVKQTAVYTEALNIFQQLYRYLLGPRPQAEYYFDMVININPDYQEMARPLEVGDVTQLPNGVRLKIWSIDRENIIRAKTIDMIQIDLRGYMPIEMHLVYPRVHGRITDRAV